MTKDELKGKSPFTTADEIEDRTYLEWAKDVAVNYKSDVKRSGYNVWYKYQLPKDFGKVITAQVVEERPKWYKPKIMKLYVFTDTGVYIWL